MMKTISLCLLLLAALQAGAQTTTPAPWVPPAAWAVKAIVGMVVLGSVLSILVIRGALFKASTWSLAEALSEEVEVSATKTGADGRPEFVLQDGKPVTVTVMRASSSRVIALMGLVVILLMFVGFGAFALYAFGQTGELPASMDKVQNFLIGGMTMFAPYVVNKFASVFQAFAPKKG